MPTYHKGEEVEVTRPGKLQAQVIRGQRFRVKGVDKTPSGTFYVITNGQISQLVKPDWIESVERNDIL